MTTDHEPAAGTGGAAETHPAVKLWRLAAFLDSEQGMNKLQWFARLTQSDPGRRYFDRAYPGPKERNDKLWADCTPDLKRFHAGQEFMHDTGMSWDEAAPPTKPEPRPYGILVATTGFAWVDPAPDSTPSVMPTGKTGTLQAAVRGTPDATAIAREQDAYAKGFAAAKALFALDAPAPSAVPEPAVGGGGLPGVQELAATWAQERAKYELSLFSGNRPAEVWLKDDAPEATVLYRGFLDDCSAWIDRKCAAAILASLSSAASAAVTKSVGTAPSVTISGAPSQDLSDGPADRLREAARAVVDEAAWQNARSPVGAGELGISRSALEALRAALDAALDRAGEASR